MPFAMQQKPEKNMTEKQVLKSLRTAGRKAPGTRVGTMVDWRDGSTKAGRLLDRYGRSLRDGK